MNGYVNFGTGELRQKLTSAHVIILHSAEVSIGYWSPQGGAEVTSDWPTKFGWNLNFGIMKNDYLCQS